MRAQVRASRIVAFLAACSLIGIFGSAVSKAAPPDWKAVGDESAALLSRYIQVDTTNPPGNELKAAQFLKDVLEHEGIEARVFETTPGRGNLYARLKGNGSRKGIVLLNHLDVVPADKRAWNVDPFGGTIKDGFVWGRGALDMKGTGVTYLMAMLQLKRQGLALKGDVVFLATADEEAGGVQGAGPFVKTHWDLIKDAGAVINEGGDISLLSGGKQLWGIDTSEKTPLRVIMTAFGTPGHASLPKDDSAVVVLIDALAKLAHYQPPVKILPEVQAYYAQIAETVEPAIKSKYLNLAESLKDPEFAARFFRIPSNRGRVRNTLSITMLEGSNKLNVIPAQASATFDMRLLPGEDPEAAVADLARVVANPAIKFTHGGPPSFGSSPVTHPLFDAVRTVAAELSPGSVVAPVMLTASTDCGWFRSRGMPCYGFVPFALTAADATTIHGNNERISIANLTFGANSSSGNLARLRAALGRGLL